MLVELHIISIQVQRCVAFDLLLVHPFLPELTGRGRMDGGQRAMDDKGSALSKRLMASFRPSGVLKCSKMSTTSKIGQGGHGRIEMFLCYRVRRTPQNTWT